MCAIPVSCSAAVRYRCSLVTEIVRLAVNGSEYAGWTDINLTRTIEAITGSFKLSITDKWSGQNQPWPIVEEDECQVISDVDGPLITGVVDARTQSYDDETHSFGVSGRDAAGALVDNSADLSTWEFVNIGVLELCNKLGAPFGIAFSLQAGLSDGAVSTSASSASSRKKASGAPDGVGSAGKSSSLKIGKPATKLTISPGDSPFDVIDRACRMVGVLPVSDGLGGVVLTRAGGTRAATALVRGENVLAADATWDGTKRYRTYKVRGQAAGTDDIFGSAVALVKGEAKDLNVRRSSRVLIVPAEGSITPAFAKQRAAWEAATRAARSADVTYTVQGWRQSNGAMWPVGALVPVRDRTLGIDGDMLIVSANFKQNDKNGTTSALRLMKPDAFTPEPVIIKPSAGSDALFRILQ
jgi:prophage tail gpP-like protein